MQCEYKGFKKNKVNLTYLILIFVRGEFVGVSCPRYKFRVLVSPNYSYNCTIKSEIYTNLLQGKLQNYSKILCIEKQ